MKSSTTTGSGAAHSIRRIMRELQEIRTSSQTNWTAWPVCLEDPYEWHFTVTGPADSSFANGIYHGRLILPPNYPLGPPSLIFLTSNGRFQVGEKVCLNATNYHPECWQPAWGIRSILEAVHAFFPSPSEGAIHSLDWPDDVRRNLAQLSTSWTCPICRISNADIHNMYCLKSSEERPEFPTIISSPSQNAAWDISQSDRPTDQLNIPQGPWADSQPTSRPSSPRQADASSEPQPSPTPPPQLSLEERIKRRSPVTPEKGSLVMPLSPLQSNNIPIFVKFVLLLIYFVGTAVATPVVAFTKDKLLIRPDSSPRDRFILAVRWLCLAWLVVFCVIAWQYVSALGKYWFIFQSADVLSVTIQPTPVDMNSVVSRLGLADRDFRLPAGMQRIIEWAWGF